MDLVFVFVCFKYLLDSSFLTSVIFGDTSSVVDLRIIRVSAISGQ